MTSFNYTITDEHGIHARPAGDLVKLAKGMDSTIIFSCNGKTADAKRMIALMSLGAKQGHVLSVEVSGTNENADAETLKKFLEENL